MSSRAYCLLPEPRFYFPQPQNRPPPSCQFANSTEPRLELAQGASAVFAGAPQARPRSREALSPPPSPPGGSGAAHPAAGA